MLRLTTIFILGFSLLLPAICRPAAHGTAGPDGKFGIHDKIYVVDQAGRRIAVQQPFDRIISLYGAHTENLFSLGLDVEIIGVSRHDDFPARALEKPVFSYHDDPERFLAARPDLVLVRPMIDRGYPQFTGMLEKTGITVVSLQPGTIEEMFVYWRILGMLTGRREQARQKILQFARSTDAFRQLTADQRHRKRVYFESIHSKMKTFAPDSMAIFALECAGGINIAADALPVRDTNIAHYGKERILARSAEIDVYLAQYGAMNRPTVSIIEKEPGFHLIKAVAAGQIFIVDEKIVSRPTSRLLDGVYTIGRYLYPDKFDDEALEIIKK